jgi:hypothetical protein
VKTEVWQGLTPKCKWNFFDAQLAEPAFLIKDNVPRPSRSGFS